MIPFASYKEMQRQKSKGEITMEDKKLLKEKELAKVSGGADPFPNDAAILSRPGHDSVYAAKPLGNHEFEFADGE